MRRFKKKKIKRLSRFGMMCMVLILCMNLIGVGYGFWTDGMDIEGVVSTGNIDPVFSKYELYELVEEGYPACSTDLRLDDGGKKLYIHIQDAYPGYSARIRFEITNQGTVPIICDMATDSIADCLSIRVNEPTGMIKGFGESKEGEVEITVGDVVQDESYEFTVNLLFEQWNTVK